MEDHRAEPGHLRTVQGEAPRTHGVPDLRQALNSASNAVTMIYEGELRPFRKQQSYIKTNHMHVHELPWPLEVLEDLGEERVSMRVTLSYFVEPSPNRVGWGVNHRECNRRSGAGGQRAIARLGV